MKTLRPNLTRLLALALVAACFPALAMVATAASFNIDLYERNPNSLLGAPSETSGVTTLPATIAPGYVVLLEQGDPSSGTDTGNRNNWGDVIAMANGNLGNNQVQLLSDPATFPSLDTVNSTDTVYILESPQGTGFDDADITTYDTGNGFIFNVHSDAPNCDGIIGTPDPVQTGPIATPSEAPSPCPTPNPPSPTPSSSSPAAGGAPANTAVPRLPNAGLKPGTPLTPFVNPVRVLALVGALILAVMVMVIGGYRYRVRT